MQSQKRFYIVSQMHGKVLDIKGGNPVSGMEVVVMPKLPGNRQHQIWYFDKDGVIRSALKDMVLDTKAGGSGIRIMPYQGKSSQQWRLQGNRIVNNAGECLDICHESQADGAIIVPYQYKGSANQHWSIEYL